MSVAKKWKSPRLTRVMRVIRVDQRGEAETIKDLEANIRDTRAAYKHIKSEFAAFLERIDHNEINQIGMFLQALWTSYAKNVSNDESSYLRISHLDFDVNQNDVSKLVSEGIITAHPDDPDQVKLMRKREGLRVTRKDDASDSQESGDGSLILGALSLGRESPSSSSGGSKGRGRGLKLSLAKISKEESPATMIRPSVLQGVSALLSAPEVHALGGQDAPEIILPPKKYGSCGDVFPLEVNYLPQNTTELQSQCNLTKQTINIIISYKKQIEYTDYECISLFNLIFRRIMSTLKMCQVNRNYYSPENKGVIPQYKLEVWPGYITSVNELDGGLVLQCDDISMRRRGDFKNESIKSLVGSVVLTRYNCKTYRIDEIDFDKNPKSTFKDGHGVEVSFVEYYKQRYGLEILDHKQPLLYNRPKARWVKQGSPELIALIPELCFLTGFKWPKNPLKMNGRHLPSDTLYFGQRHKEKVGPSTDWTKAITSRHVLTPIQVNNWVLIFPYKLKDVARGFFQYFEKQGPRLGISISCPTFKELSDDRSDSYVRAMRELISPDIQLIVTIFPNLRADRYSAVKKFCYLERPVASQVILSKTISQERRMISVVQKITLQINCKLGGELWGADVPKDNLMVVGVDVFHDPNRRLESVAGLVASMNPALSRWFSKSTVQNPGEELIKSLKVEVNILPIAVFYSHLLFDFRGPFSECLVRYKGINGVLPDYIVIFRDGLGNSQLEVSAKYEMEQLTSSLTDCYSSSLPSFTFIVVQKLSQRVNEGSATPSHYIVIKEGRNTSPDFLQGLSYRLTHMYYNWPGTIRYAHKLAAMVGENLQKEPSSSLNDKLFYFK
ncbi:AUB [Lepeophtheirus salmonis]|uniref:AUB n=1 Tax=Lepeophtheirus salmonis TaxID=72036 RepID=A0A7R8CFG9_LEPSM|nr:AUB [Lepeophtheirus salmonis]CAF2766083.1 AUB [Lepeophtheirus salmonis]